MLKINMALLVGCKATAAGRRPVKLRGWWCARWKCARRNGVVQLFSCHPAPSWNSTLDIFCWKFFHSSEIWLHRITTKWGGRRKDFYWKRLAKRVDEPWLSHHKIVFSLASPWSVWFWADLLLLPLDDGILQLSRLSDKHTNEWGL